MPITILRVEYPVDVPGRPTRPYQADLGGPHLHRNPDDVRADRRLLARRMSAPPPPSVTASGEVVGSDFGRRGEHPGVSMSVAWMPIGRACQRLAFTVSDVRRSQRTARNTSIKSRDAQDPVPILVTGLLSVPITERLSGGRWNGPGRSC